LSTNAQLYSTTFLRLLPASALHRKVDGMLRKAVIIIAFATLLSGCASIEGDFPSLSKRAYETDTPVEDPAAMPAPITTALPADLERQTDALVARARKAHNAFESALGAARSTAQSASGTATGSEAWVNAHMVLSRTDGARADAVAALGEMDQLITRERDKGADVGLVALLSGPQGQIAELVNAENAEVDRLARVIGL
jgi:hypothetical protein